MKDETNKPILKVGDKIRIKSKEWFDSQPKNKDGNIFINDSTFFTFMAKYCGEECTITSIHKYTGGCAININDFIWYPWMFDLVDEEKKEEPQYKVGDKVVINSIDWYNNNKNEDNEISGEGFIFNADMKEYCGKICTIDACHKDFDNADYYMLKGNGYSWSPWMFSPAKEPTKEKSKKRRSSFIREPQTGDTIRSPYFNGIIIGENNDKSAFLILTTPYFYKQWLDKDVITEIDGYGRYLYDIDTNECDLDIRADKFRKYFMSSDYYTEKVTTSEEQLSNSKDNDSQSNSSKFDLSKVVYKSRRIK